jgi:hypothetical protein
MYTLVKYINSVVITDRERDVEIWKNFKVYFKWGWNKSPFDINSVVFHFAIGIAKCVEVCCYYLHIIVLF